MELKFDQLQPPRRKLLLTLSARVSCVRIKLRNTYITLFGIHWFLLLNRPFNYPSKASALVTRQSACHRSPMMRDIHV